MDAPPSASAATAIGATDRKAFEPALPHDAPVIPQLAPRRLEPRQAQSQP